MIRQTGKNNIFSMEKFEYKQVSSSCYKRYMEMASILLKDIAKFLNKKKERLIYSDIVSYFESQYDITFTFFEIPKNKSILPTNNFIKYDDIAKNSKFDFLEEKLANKLSGVTIPDEHNNHTVIWLNQAMPKSRIIFTLLHELVHLHFHNTCNEKHLIFASKFSGVYSEAMESFETESNIIASLLFCSTEQLESFLLNGSSFTLLCSQTCMSKSAMHNRLINYFQYVLKLNSQEALHYVLNLRENDKKTSYKIKTLISKHKQNTSTKIFSIKMSNSLTLVQSECQNFLKRKNTQELILELEYAHSTKNHLLEQLVMDEYYKKQSN